MLDAIKKGSLFKMLASKTLYEVGLEYGFDKKYKDSKAVKGAVYRIYQEVKKDPAKYYVQPETVELVTTSMTTRLSSPVIVKGGAASLREKNDELINKTDIKSLVISGRNKAYSLISHKMDRLGASKKKLDAVSVGELAKVFGILFDKAQIIQGEATEHVAIMAKVSKDMNPEQALETVLKMREIAQIERLETK